MSVCAREHVCVFTCERVGGWHAWGRMHAWGRWGGGVNAGQLGAIPNVSTPALSGVRSAARGGNIVIAAIAIQPRSAGFQVSVYVEKHYTCQWKSGGGVQQDSVGLPKKQGRL